MIKNLQYLLVLALFVLTAQANAASMVQLSKMSDPAVESYVQTYEMLKDYWYNDVASQALRVRFTSKKKEQTWSNAFKQAIYYHRVKLWGPYSKPEGVGISAALKTPSQIKGAIQASLNYADLKDPERFINALYYKAGRAKAGRQWIQFYDGIDGNSFGQCSWMMIMDYQHKEAVYLSGCYSE